VRVIHRALDAGINFVDTADVYVQGESEEIVGKALAGGKRDRIVLATKAHGQMGDDPNHQGNSRRWITRAVEDSLRRLGTDWIDLYQIHRPDPSTDIDETLGALTDLVRAGKIRYFGSSTFPAHEIVEAQWVAERRGHVRFRSEQPPYSMLVRGIETSILPTCERYGMGVLTWSPLAAGWLSGKYQEARTTDMSTVRARLVPQRFDLSLPGNARKLEIVDGLAAVAQEAGLSLTHMAVGFVLAHPSVTAAIIGPRTMDHLQDLLAVATVELDDATLDRIDELVPPGTNLNTADAGWTPPSLADKALRRRPQRDRSAA
jgi:aryl-alcohol dehydrogenase-like predicted oxidoreductase